MTASARSVTAEKADESTLLAYPQRYLDSWGQRDISVALDVISPEIRWFDPSLPEPLVDTEGARLFYESTWQGFPDITFQPVGSPIVDLDRGLVAHEWRFTGTHTGEGFPPGVPPTGKSFDVPGMDVFRVDANGRAVEIHAYWDVLNLMTQLGLA
ncbi:ester cyclase [Gordonia aichiensis]|uniref:SnoaL-like domain-containing protein n=1 Tax=Gordonia aichiensis NBRC 108223 TaxID=1220583 RepID=L7KMK9_9ACTN|nr:ester cyclase [Gordonia aichiensis]GAC49192.1 hypothetical protein GOACH_10_01600 [Gordonia aichiensis NBRC 108223]